MKTCSILPRSSLTRGKSASSLRTTLICEAMTSLLISHSERSTKTVQILLLEREIRRSGQLQQFADDRIGPVDSVPHIAQDQGGGVVFPPRRLLSR